MKEKRIAIIGTVGVPARYGGFETLAHQLVLNLRSSFDITVYNSTKHYSAKERVKEWNGARIKYIPLSANGFSSIFYDIFSMVHAVFSCQVLLILGVSGCLFLPLLKLFFPHRKIIVNVDGLEWRRPKWNYCGKLFLRMSEWFAIRFADEVVADNAGIQKYVFDCYGVNANLIEYGGDHNEAKRLSENTLQQFPFLQEDYAFKVARIEPENNIHLILEAFSQQDQLPLVLVGNWEVSDYGKSLWNAYQDHPQLYLLNPIYEKSLLNELRSNAKMYIHGHSEGGTNPSLVEAMYLQLPIIAFDVIYNKITTEYEAPFFKDAPELLALLNSLDQMDIPSIADRLSAVAQSRYRWSVIAQKYSQLASGWGQKPTPVFDFELPQKLQQAIG